MGLIIWLISVLYYFLLEPKKNNYKSFEKHLIPNKIATFYSCGVTFTHELTNVSGKWIAIFGLGNAAGAMSMPLVGTQLVFRYVLIVFQSPYFVLFN